jgi:hypothetical protein
LGRLNVIGAQGWQCPALDVKAGVYLISFC